MQRTKTYQERSRAFLSQAHEELATGDLEQASEKAWIAAALAVEAAAEQRGLIHESHNHLFGVVCVLVEESGNQELRQFFKTADELHHNFYEHRLTTDEISDDIGEVERFVEGVEGFL